MAKILIVEDEMLAAIGLRDIFEELGYDVCTLAASGKQAIDIAEREHPDVVLMDIKLPGGMNGIEAAQQIHSRFGIPFAYITGYEDPEIKERANATDPIGFFLKPLNCQKIQAAIDEALRNN